MLMQRMIVVVGLALLAGASCSLDSSGESPRRTPVEEAESLMGERRHAEAAAAWGRAFDAAIDSSDCGAAERAARGLREAAYLARGSDVVAAAEARALAAPADVAPCLPEALVQLAVARDLLGEGDAGMAMLGRARDAAADPRARLRLARALDLLGRAPSTRLDALRLGTTPGAGDDTVWVHAAPAVVDRADQVLDGAASWTGPTDASLRVRSAVLNRNLFFLVEIRDDDPGPEDAEEDALVLAIDLERGTAPLHRRSPEPGRRVFVVGVPTAPTPGRVAVPAPRRAWRSASAIEGGRTVLFCLPQDCVEGLAVEAGDSYAFDVLYRDRDADGVSRLRAWSPEADPAAMFLSGALTIPDEFPSHEE